MARKALPKRGAPRRPKDEKRKKVETWLLPDELSEVETQARRRGLRRSACIRVLLLERLRGPNFLDAH